MAYRTEGKQQLMDFFVDHPDCQFTAEEIYQTLSRDGVKTGKSSVYRQLSGLCEEHLVRRFRAEGAEYLYQYMGARDCAHHFHLKCMSCGRVLHLECGMSEELLLHIRNNHGFSVDSGRSMLFGVCEACGKERKTTKEENHGSCNGSASGSAD